jgi:protein-L-isoaspartate(D-aspartate) O-methyltransferase
MENIKLSLAKQTDIKTNLMLYNINNDKIISMFLKSNMESFLPESLQSLAYSDSSICYYNNRYLMDIYTLGHIMLLSGTNLIGKALVIGCGNGFVANFLSSICQEVIGVDEDEFLIEQARIITKNLGKTNVHFSCQKLNNIELENQFDLIIVDGAVLKVVDNWLNLLSNKSILISVVYQNGLKNIIKYQKNDNSILTTKGFHSSLPFLIGFNNINEFVF